MWSILTRWRAQGAVRPDIELDLILLAGGLFLVFVGANAAMLGWPPTNWDLMFLCGWGVFVLGLILVRQIPVRFEIMVDRLVRRGIVQGDIAPDSLKALVRSKMSLWQTVGAGAAGVAMFAATAIAARGGGVPGGLTLVLGLTLAAIVAGFHLGRMCAFGTFGHRLAKAGVSLQPVPGHIDGAAGLKPVGDFYLFQALVASLPASHLAAWLLLLPFFNDRHDVALSKYQEWRRPYEGLLVVAILFDVGAFVLPMWHFHSVMRAQRERCRQLADQLSKEIAEIDQRANGLEDSDAAKALATRRETLVRGYDALESMPTWPVDARTKRAFSAQNVLLALPLLFSTLGVQPVGLAKDLIAVAQKMSAGK